MQCMGGTGGKGASAVGEASVRAGKGACCRQRRDLGPAPRRDRPGPHPTRKSQRNHLEACFPGRGEAADPALALQPGSEHAHQAPKRGAPGGGQESSTGHFQGPPQPGQWASSHHSAGHGGREPSRTTPMRSPRPYSPARRFLPSSLWVTERSRPLRTM